MIKRNQEYVLRYGGDVKPQRVMHIGPSEPFRNRPGYCAFVNIVDMKAGMVLMHHVQQGNFRVNGEEVVVINPNVPACYLESYSERANPDKFNELCKIIAGGTN